MDGDAITAIVTGITTIAGLIFIKKRKTKITKRKTKTIDTIGTTTIIKQDSTTTKQPQEL